MQNKNLILALLMGSLSLPTANLIAAQSAQDQIAPLSPENRTQNPAPAAEPHPMDSNYRVSSVLGMVIRNDAGERLGKVQDLIVSMDSRTVPFVIIERGGALGIGATRVAVPLAGLKWAADHDQLILAATKEQLDSASTTPTGGWLAVAGEDCMKNVNRFYGQPSAINYAGRYERQEAAEIGDGREPVRNSQADLKAPNGQQEQATADPELKHQVVTPTDEYLMGKINGIIRQDVGDAASKVQVTLKSGMVTLKGKVASDAQKKLLESQIKAIGGIDQVQNDLSISSY